MAAAGVNVNQSGASYIVGKDDTTYYATRQSDGVITNTNADAGVVINAALAACGSTGYGRVVLGVGVFIISTGILIPLRCDLVGQGRDKTYIQTVGSITAITLSTGSYETRNRVEGMTLDGNSVGLRGIYAARKYIVELKDLRIEKFTTYGIQGTDAVFWKLDHVRLYQNGSWGASFAASATVPTTVFCNVVTTNDNVTGGVYCEAHGFSFRDCAFEAQPIGLKLKSCLSGVIENTWFEAIADQAIYLDGSAANQAIGIRSNTFSGCGYPIYATGTNDLEIGINNLTNCTHNHYFGQYCTKTMVPQIILGTTPKVMEDANRNWQNSEYYCGDIWAIRAIRIEDDFCGTSLNTHLWTVADGTIAHLNQLGGFVRLTTGAVTDDQATLTCNGMRFAAVSKAPRIAFRAGPIVSVTNQDIFMGLSEGGVSASHEGVWFERLAADTNWFAITCDGATQTRTDTGVVCATGYKYFEIIIENTVAYFFIDGVLVATNTATYPATGTQLEPWFQTITREDVVHYLELDMYKHFQSRV